MPEDEREQGFRALYAAQYDAVWRYVARRVPASGADEVIADTFLVAWRRLADVPAGPDARLWLYAVARRCVANHVRGERRRARVRARLVEAGGPTAPVASDDPEVARALEHLAEADRELLRLLYWEELSHPEAATVLGVSTNAVAIRAHRARRRLAGLLPARKNVGEDGHVGAMLEVTDE